MKNWNYITGAKIGNRTASEIQKEIAEVESSIDSYYRAGENPPKNLEDRLKRLKAELANAKTGNSTEKLFEGLTKDVEEKEEEKTESIEELEKVNNTWTPEQALKYYEEAKKAKDENKINEIKNIIRQEKNGAYKHYQELQSRKDDITHNNAGYGKVAYYNEAKKKFEAWQDVAAKVGNSTPDEYNAEIQRLTKKAEQLRRMGQGKQAMDVEKQIEKLGKELREYTKTGNSVSDDKFAYVMREFDEGKLKTPDGKVVTDPQQAKAIAYSESKKTENGLARARNAMKKNS